MKKDSSMAMLTNDNFVWVVIPDETKAKKLFDADVELYAVDIDRGVEKLIDNRLEIEACFGLGVHVAIEGGFISEKD